ncbi:hypothetical protein ABBQ32_005265 [Trebouxia sp. C0010 RCD-2024]
MPASFISPQEVRRANLIEVLLEAANDDGMQIDGLPEDAALHWSEERIRNYFKDQRNNITGNVDASHEPLKAADTRSNTRFPSPSDLDFQAWIPGLERSQTMNSSPKCRVLCFHNAGSAEDMYTSEGTGTRRSSSPLLDWCRQVGAECLAVQLPGRGMRAKEPFLPSMQEAVRQLLPVLASRLQDTPYVVIAHSMGAWTAYEFLLHARANGLAMPVKAFLSAMPHPDIPVEQRPWRQQARLDEAQFQAECKGWDVSSVVFSPALWPTYQAIMRADFKLFDEYEHTPPGEPFAFPISTFHGTRDRRVTRAMVEGWQRLTTGSFSCAAVEGTHLWPLDKTAKTVWLQAIVAQLSHFS